MLNLSCSISSSFASKSLCTICLSCSAAISKRSLALKNNLKKWRKNGKLLPPCLLRNHENSPSPPENFILRKGGREDPIKNYKPRLSDSFFPAIIHCTRQDFQIYFALSFLLPSHLLTVFRLKLELSVPPEVSCTPKFPPQIFSLISRVIEKEQISPGIL